VTQDLKRVQQHDQAGWRHVDAKEFEAAAGEFEAALQLFPDYADALHGLGKARMALRDYQAAARAFERCRDSYAHAGTQDAEHQAIAAAVRRSQIDNLRRRVADLEGTAFASSGTGRGVNPPSSNNDVLELKLQIRELEAQRDTGAVTGKPPAVPAFVSLALGSAYFRLERMADAEREFRSAIAVQPKFGEARSNLALVCLLTGRAAEAQEHVKIAEEARFTVSPELKRQIREALGR